MGSREINKDLAEERKNATFDTLELTNFLDGNKEKTNRRKELENLFYNDPEVQDAVPSDYLTYPEMYDDSLRKSFHIFHKAMELADPQEILSIADAILQEASPLTVHFVMFIPALMGLATEDQQANWLPDAFEMKIIGSYAQTELGHGTFLRGLETTATYDPETQEFVLHSPTLSSIKWWPGGLGKTANFAIVQAQLYTKGRCYGLHPFMVQIRNRDNHEPLPGITVGEIGPKVGFRSSDNGFLKLDHVRIPRENMLMKNSQVWKHMMLESDISGDDRSDEDFNVDVNLQNALLFESRDSDVEDNSGNVIPMREAGSSRGRGHGRGQGRGNNVAGSSNEKYTSSSGTNPASAWRLMVSESMVKHIQSCTIAEAQCQLRNDSNWHVTLEDLDVFFALLYARGALGHSKLCAYDLWNKNWGSPVFKETMPRNRFRDIMRYLRFDVRSTRADRLATNKFALASETWYKLMETLLCYNPGLEITVDEQCCLVNQDVDLSSTWRINWTSLAFGIKSWLATDVKSKYVLNDYPYLGKDEERQINLQLGESVVLKLLEPEVQILDYQAQKYKLLPMIAFSHACKATFIALMDTYKVATQNMEKGDLATLPELHATSSGLKALCTDVGSAAIEVCRKACGGHGYLMVSGIPRLYATTVAACTYEGENTVLYLQTARYLSKVLKGQQPVSRNSVFGYLLDGDKTIPQYIDYPPTFEQLVACYCAAAQKTVFKAAARVQSFVDAGKVQEIAWNLSHVDLIAAAKAHVLYYIVQRYVEWVQNSTVSTGLKEVLVQLCYVFLLQNIHEQSGIFMMIGLSEAQIDKMHDYMLEMLERLRPNAVALVDAFDFHDMVLSSALGCYDGNVYERLFEWAQKTPMNQKQVHEAYYKYLQPVMKSKL
ncbi:peroxisomal acyl-coenzyme A oxidase 1-like [Stegodyphus dumicola]|uniref:peroxisomal acyl-coenzyme A oxidase 1-like n=1 Tax=Stegodyphus dumicola TaxID=202533 RepID=UPI0015B11177|nr:peroxisomal acyl-coenzyme A oxidase 1-like [Stegodyphus dumicola]